MAQTSSTPGPDVEALLAKESLLSFRRWMLTKGYSELTARVYAQKLRRSYKKTGKLDEFKPAFRLFSAWIDAGCPDEPGARPVKAGRKRYKGILKVERSYQGALRVWLEDPAEPDGMVEILIDPEDLPLLQKYPWHVAYLGKVKAFNVIIRVYLQEPDGKKHVKTIYFHRAILRLVAEDKVVCFLNGNRKDFRKGNLRVMSRSELVSYQRRARNHAIRMDGTGKSRKIAEKPYEDVEVAGKKYGNLAQALDAEGAPGLTYDLLLRRLRNDWEISCALRTPPSEKFDPR